MLHLGNAISVFQSTLSMRRATQPPVTNTRRSHISIHALHEESDWHNPYPLATSVHFNPRSP